MSNDIKTRLNELKREVDDFHPFLNTLFKKMKKITHVHYTHGQHEMGADFVLETMDEILSTQRYIGAVVKLGAIVQNNMEVDRQIEECGIERIVGKKKIYLDEIWVVSNKSISHNAKVKIHDKYKNKNIQFIDGEHLVKLTEDCYPEYGSNINIPVGNYLSETRTANIEAEKRTSLLAISGDDVFIDQLIQQVEDDHYSTKNKKRKTSKKKSEEIISVVNKHNFMMIEGPMGSGKSKLLRKVCSYYADNQNYLEEERLPIQATFHQVINDYDCNISDLIDDTTKGIGDSLDVDKYIIVIDGVDEVDKSMDERIDDIKKISTYASSNIKILLAGRTVDDSDLEAKLKGAITRFEICPITFDNMIKFITKTCAKLNISDKIMDDLSHSQLLKVLPRTPIAAILVAKLLSENSEDIPSNMTELYSKYTELCMGRWDLEDKGFKSQKEYTSSSAIIANIAEYMINNQLHEISQDEAKGYFKEYLDSRNLGIEVDELFDNMLARCEIVYRDDKKKTISFKHKTFAEYYYAKKLEQKGKIDLDERSFDLYWSNIVFFYVGLKRDCPELLEQIINFDVDGDKLTILRLINLGNLLLAGYASPYNTISKGIHVIFDEAAQYFVDLRRRNKMSFLSKFSSMDVLSILRTVMYNGYSYEFFKDAIDGSITEVYGNNDTDDEKKAVQLFLLNIAYIEAGGDSQLEVLIDKMGTSLPMPVRLAIGHEANDLKLKELMATMKKMDTKLKKQARKNTGLRSSINDLYEKPLEKLKIT